MDSRNNVRAGSIKTKDRATTSAHSRLDNGHPSNQGRNGRRNQNPNLREIQRLNRAAGPSIPRLNRINPTKNRGP
jgi:hypothetical protein